MTGLLELAERCEQASGPSITLNREIMSATSVQCHAPHGFTHSLDMATRLVPDGHVWGCGTDAGEPENKPWAWCDEAGELPDDYLKFAATPALALCAAALRARASQEAAK